MKKRLLTFLLAGALLFSAAGCGQTPAESRPVSGSSAAVAESAVSEGTGSAGEAASGGLVLEGGFRGGANPGTAGAFRR